MKWLLTNVNIFFNEVSHGKNKCWMWQKVRPWHTKKHNYIILYHYINNSKKWLCLYNINMPLHEYYNLTIIFDQTCVFFRTVILPWIGVKWHVPMLTLIRQSVMCKNHIYTILFSENNINMSYTELKGLYHLRETIGSGSVM